MPPGETNIHAFDGILQLPSDPTRASKWLVLWQPVNGYIPQQSVPFAINNEIWIQVGLPAPKTATSYAIVSANDLEMRDPRDWHLLGSHDASTWSVLDSRCGEVFLSRYERRTFTVTNPGKYKFYRLFIENNAGSTEQNGDYNRNGNGMVQLSEVELYSDP